MTDASTATDANGKTIKPGDPVSFPRGIKRGRGTVSRIEAQPGSKPTIVDVKVGGVTYSRPAKTVKKVGG